MTKVGVEAGTTKQKQRNLLWHLEKQFLFYAFWQAQPLQGRRRIRYSGSIVGFNGAFGLAFDPDGNLCVSNYYAGISVFSGPNPSTGATSVSTLSGLSSPAGLAFDKSGNLYAANQANSNVVVFNKNTLLSNPTTSNGTLSGFSAAPGGLAFDRTGNLYVSDENGNISVFLQASLYSSPGTPKTTVIAPDITQWGSNNGISGSFGLTSDNNGDIYVVSDGTSVSFMAAGSNPQNTSPVSSMTAINTINFGLVVDNYGFLYGGNDTNKTVDVYNISTGTKITTIGTTGIQGQGEFNLPQFISISQDGQFLYVVDGDNNNVQIFLIRYPFAAQQMISQTLGTFMPSGDAAQMVETFMQGPRNAILVAAPPSAVQNVASSTVKAMMPMSQITNFGGSPAATIANTVLGGAFDAQNANRSAAFHSFTPIQKQKFTQLTQQLPFLQFQSVQSLAEPIQVPVNYATQATPFEQPKITLKPVFLANEKSHVWIQPYGGLQRLESYDQVTGLSFKTGGTAFGVGHYVSDTIILGVLTGGAISSYAQDQSSGTGTIDNAYLGIYGGYSKPEGGLNVDGSVIYGQSRYTAERNINALGLIAKNSHKGWDASTRVQVGYKAYYDSLSVNPFVAAGYRYSYQNSYQETNAYPFNLTIPSSQNKTATLEIGAKFQQTMVVNDVLVKPLIGLSVLREHPVSKAANANISFSDSGNSFAVPISTQIKTYATATIGCAAMFTNNISISTLVTGKVKKHEKSLEALVKVSYAF